MCGQRRAVRGTLDTMKILLVLVVLVLAGVIYRVVRGEATMHILSRRFGPMLCRFAGHKRRGDSVRKIEGVYHSRCRRCGTRLRKLGRDGEWEVAPPELVRELDAKASVAPADEPRERNEEHTVISLLLVAAAAAAGALSLGWVLAPHDVAMRHMPPHKSFADLTR